MEKYRPFIELSGCTSVVSLIKVWGQSNPESLPSLPNAKMKKDFTAKVQKLKEHLILRRWLKKKDLFELKELFFNHGVHCIKDLYEFDDTQLTSKLTLKQFDIWMRARDSLLHEDYSEIVENLWLGIEEEAKQPWTTAGIFILSLCVALFTGMVLTMSQPRLEAGYGNQKLGFLSYVTGRYLSPLKCKVVFDWTEPQVVGNTMSFTVKFFQRNGQAYPICNEDNVLIEITQGAYKIACSVELGGPQISDANIAKVQFTVRRAGEYRICVLVGMTHIQGSPFIKSFVPGPPDPVKTCFIHHCSTVVGSEDIPTQLFIEPRDKYGNLCTVDKDCDPANEYSVDIIEVNTGRPIPDSFRWECYSLISRLVLVLKFPREGCYRATVSYKGQTIQNGDFHVIILNQEESFMVQKNVAKKNKCYEVKLLALNGERYQKPKKVYCYISPKQLTLKEYMWKFFPKHLITFRLCPSTKFKFQSSRNILQGDPILVIDDGCQQEVELISVDRNIIAATFTQFLLKNIGGSETFKDKQDFFQHEVRKYHQKHFHDKIFLKIVRETLLETSFKETKNFSVSDWCKNFEITFVGEEGIDWGGLRREWFELVCSSLFDPENLLFHSFKSDKQGLVHPCPSYKRPCHLKLKYYEFAGKVVGKCLYESSLGSSYRQLVKAKFSRSFLAQLIGLSVHYKYFEHDDPELYVSKVKYILENDIESMGLYFIEEVYDVSGQLLEEVELIPNGSNTLVTNANKIQYLNALAQYRLTTSVKQEIEHFLKGLTELIPDNLLCIFDENELELLMCGTGSYSIADFKANHALSGATYEFRKVLEWFWIAVSNFSEEEMARLLQFTTGCSQLPPGGFAELNPKFHISAAQTFGNLPTAHTCFNQLCLPDYDSYEQFEKALRLAISEGSEGFGMV
ncbi:apoptosis-resistant E3 ubiquitin protein ligase 1 [Trichonephila clavata]|uniref:HECT-type E3 ubiquitin transferase n=1 Tax=Trichonephila clavata TaxID=2740835 RepID=A0A8X6HRR9_TRICU|nr:apoptosis-resistant E3 ubiquitin protein ligase 1 [Trichonephila clavata]